MNNLKQQTLINFKKTESLIERIIRMIEEDRYCIEIMQQNLAALGLLKSAHQMLMENHLKSCFKTAMAAKDNQKKNKMTNEILTVTKLYNK